LAFTKEQKTELVAIYEDWLNRSNAVFMMEYTHMSMKEVNELHKQAREAGGEIHVVKNTLMNIALKNVEIPYEKQLTGTTLVGFAFEEPPAMAKVFSDAAKEDQYEIKAGLLDNKELSLAEIKSLAALPPLPVMRAMLLGTIMAPASKLVRTVAEPARGLAAVVKAYSDKEGAASAA
jgi:large subunit ribosomal protein L10